VWFWDEDEEDDEVACEVADVSEPERLKVAVAADAAEAAERVVEDRVDRIEGLRILVGGGGARPAEVAPVEDEDEEEDEVSSLSPFDFSCVRSLSFLTLGLGGGLSKSLFIPPFLLALLSSKSKIFPKFSPTFGDLLKSLTSSAGEGVARISPVVVRTTPFIAEGIKSEGRARVTGVSIAVDGNCDERGRGVGWDDGWVSNLRRRCCWVGVACATRERGSRRFFTSSNGFLSLRPAMLVNQGVISLKNIKHTFSHILFQLLHICL